MRLTEVMQNVRQRLLEVQQVLLDRHPNFETQIVKLEAEDDYYGGYRDTVHKFVNVDRGEDILCMLVHVLDIHPVLVYATLKSGHVGALGTQGQGHGHNTFQNSSCTAAKVADDVFSLLVEGLEIQCSISEYTPRNDVVSVFKTFVESKKLSTVNKLVSIVYDLEVGNKGLQDIENRYNGTVLSAINFVDSRGQHGTAILLVKD